MDEKKEGDLPKDMIERVRKRLRAKQRDREAAREAHRRGFELNRKGKRQEAHEQWLEAVRLDPSCAEARLSLGIDFLIRKMPREAEREIRELIRLRPQDSHSYYLLSRALAAQGKRAQAKEAEMESVWRWFILENIDFIHAVHWAHEGQKNVALRYLDQAVDSGFDNWLFWSEKGLLEGLQGDPRFVELAAIVRERWEAKRKKSRRPRRLPPRRVKDGVK